MQLRALHFIDGEKGGIGKSFFTRTFIQYCLDKGIPFALIDGDPSGADVGRFYFPDAVSSGKEHLDDRSWYRRIAFEPGMEAEMYKLDAVFETAYQQGDRLVVVNLPASVHEVMTRWIQQNRIFEVAELEGVTLHKWFLCSGDIISVNFFLQSAKYYGEQIPHTLVRNQALFKNWANLPRAAEVTEALKRPGYASIDLPRLGPREVRYLDDNALPLAKGKESSARKEIGVFGMMRVKNYIEEIYPQLDQSTALSAFRPETNGKPPAQAEKPAESSARAVKSKR